MHVKEIRAKRLLELLNDTPGLGKQVKLGARIRKAPAQISQWINGTRTITEDTARAIERNLKLPIGWLDADSPSSGLVVNEVLPPEYIGPPWPFKTVSIADVRALSAVQVQKLEGVMCEFIDIWLAAPSIDKAKKHHAR